MSGVAPNLQNAPSVVDAEKAILASMIHSQRALSGATDMLTEEAFHDPSNRIIWACILTMATENKPIDLVTVTMALDALGKLELVGGPAYVSEIFTFVPTGANWKEYAEKIREAWVARKAIQVAEQIIQAARDPGARGTIADLAQSKLIEITGVAKSRVKTKHIREIGLRRINHYEEALNGGGKIEGILTGLSTLDRRIRGLRPGNMIVIAAETKGGKTALAMNIALYAALSDHGVGVFSLEMNEGELFDRIVSAHSGVNLSDLTNGAFTQQKMDAISKSSIDLLGKQILIRDESVITPAQFSAAAREMVTVNKVELIVFDYLQLVTPADPKANREQQVAHASRVFKTTAAELGIPIIVLSQLNEEGRSRESRAIEQDANLFIVIEEVPVMTGDGKKKEPLLDDDGEPVTRHYLNIKLARDVPKGRIPIVFNREVTRFEEPPK